jgi:hypothetical protein
VSAYLVAECVSISVDYRAPRCGSEILTDSATIGTYSDSRAKAGLVKLP